MLRGFTPVVQVKRVDGRLEIIAGGQVAGVFRARSQAETRIADGVE